MTKIASALSPIGPVPDDWAVKPLQAVVRPLGRKNVGLVETNLLSLSYGSIIRKDIEALEGLLPESFEGYQIVEEDDVVFRFTDLQNDQRSLRSGLAHERGIITSAYLAVRPTSINARYFAYLMRAYDQEKVFYSFGGGVRQSLKFDDVKRLPIPVPSVERQQRIAEFLDRETAQIDELIAKQEQLISTLAERLSAEIHAAVTAGMEPVGTVQLRHVALVLDCKHITAEFVEEGYPLVSIGETRDEFIDLENAKRTTKEYFDLLREGGRDPRPGDLIFTRNATVGNVSRVGDFTETFALGQDVCLIRPSGQELNAAFLQAQLLGPLIRSQLDGFMVGSTFKRVNVQQVRSLRLVVPDLSIQEEVVAQVRRKRVETETLIARTQSVIGLLRERRQALISAAVTGQIDAGGAS